MNFAKCFKAMAFIYLLFGGLGGGRELCNDNYPLGFEQWKSLESRKQSSSKEVQIISNLKKNELRAT